MLKLNTSFISSFPAGEVERGSFVLMLDIDEVSAELVSDDPYLGSILGGGVGASSFPSKDSDSYLPLLKGGSAS